MTPRLSCTAIGVSYGNTEAVQDIDLSVAPGEAVGLLGPNGAGKSTTMRVIAGVQPPDRGSVTLDGVDVYASRCRPVIGYVPQDLAVYEDMTGRQNLRFWSRIAGVSRRQIDASVAEILERTLLVEVADNKVRSYSGGYKRRLNLAIGLVNDPSLLVVDEPTVGLDPQARDALLATLATVRDEGLSILYATHYLHEVERLCDRVLVLDNGRLIADSTPERLRTDIGIGDRITIRVTDGSDRLQTWFAVRPDVTVVEATTDMLVLHVHSDTSSLAVIVEGAAAVSAQIHDVTIEEANLEATFLAMLANGPGK
jgi:ABC-2 type transport system ATP-binding protein